MVLNCCNPYQETALNTVYPPDLPDTLRRGIAAAQAGHKTEARNLLTAVIEADESQAEAWRWLGQVVDSLDDKIIVCKLGLKPPPLGGCFQPLDSVQVVWGAKRRRKEMVCSPNGRVYNAMYGLSKDIAFNL